MKRAKGYSLERRKIFEGYMFVSVWIFGFLAFTFMPLFSSIKISLTQGKISDLLNGEWVGLQNYRDVIADPFFGSTFMDTITRSLIEAPLISVFALIAAVLLNGDIIAKSYFRAVYFAPVIISGLLINILNTQGASDFSIFEQLGSDSFAIGDFIGEDTFNRMGEILWRSSVEILIFLAGLQSIPRPLYESAQMDGATPWECFWKITVPMMSPILLLTIIYATIDSFVAPGNPIMDYIKQKSFSGLNFGFGAALSWMYFLFVLVIILIIFLIGRRLTNEGASR